MLESIAEELSVGLRSTASKIASKHGCIVTSTLDVHLNDFPVFSQRDPQGLVSNIKTVMALTVLDMAGYMRVSDFIAETEPSSLIGVTASGRPRLLIVPAIVNVLIEGKEGDSDGYVSAVGIYTLRPMNRGVRFAAPFTSVPYKER
ncbi:hypothetical protein HYU20_01485 [Candidatus Woesearchaeota archaeon]|nr:hypothetical protein [Candidatus Woesearchaeota archaeon]